MKLSHKIVTLALASLIASGNIQASPSWWQKAVNFAQEHPYLTAGVAVGVGAGIYFYKRYSYKMKLEEEEKRRRGDEWAAAHEKIFGPNKPGSSEAQEATRHLQEYLSRGVSRGQTTIDFRDVDWLEGLLKKGANPNAPDFHSMRTYGHWSPNTALMYAMEVVSSDPEVMAAMRKIVILFLDYGANLTLTNSKGKTALDIANKYRNNQMVNLLTNYPYYKNFKAIENDPQSYVSLLPRELKDMASNYIMPK